MLVTITDVLSRKELEVCRAELEKAQWIDGRVTAGVQSGAVKHNLQIPERSASAKRLGELILDALSRNEIFISAALPLRIFPPMFNCYGVGQRFGAHVDNAVRRIPDTPVRIRTDLSCTLFLCDPSAYEGGELVVEDSYGEHRVKLPAGGLVLYPSTSLHHVTEITSGERTASIVWLQSMVRDDSERSQLFELDRAVQALSAERGPGDAICVRLSNIYHNLVRRWAEI